MCSQKAEGFKLGEKLLTPSNVFLPNVGKIVFSVISQGIETWSMLKLHL